MAPILGRPDSLPHLSIAHRSIEISVALDLFEVGEAGGFEVRTVEFGSGCFFLLVLA